MAGFYLFIAYFQIIHSICNCEYSNEWLAEIHAELQDVKIITERYGFEYINTINDSLFILRHIYSPRSSRTRAEGIRKSIEKETQVKYMEQQKWNKRALRSVTVNDPLWSKMWYLNGNIKPDMGVLNSWSNGYTGKYVTIGIVDDGVEVGHPDIKPNVNTKLSYDLIDRDNDPSPTPGNPHGTECAGVASAVSNNSVCVTGVAFHSQIAGIRLLGPSGSTATGEHDALLRSGIDIFSNSWGIAERDQFDGPSPIVKSALLKGVKQGRNGLGSIYLWAAGNGGTDDNCNCDGFVNSIYTIAISSVSSNKQPPGYAEPCAAIMASAFSGGGGSSNNICSTSLSSSCVTTFTGTSAATPMAAGIFALVLQANPGLTWRDVQHLIVNTSDMTSLKYGKIKTNGAGHTVSDFFGFGLLKSDLLTDRAKTWKLVPKQRTCLSTRITVKQQIYIKSPNRTVSSNIYTDGCNGSKSEIQRLEHVEVDVKYLYSLRGAVQLYLISPSGTKSQLLSRRGLDMKKNSQQVWTFMSVQFWDENPTGNWTIQMSLDMDYRETGELTEWTLRLYGTTTKYDTTETNTSGTSGTSGTRGTSRTTGTSDTSGTTGTSDTSSTSSTSISTVSAPKTSDNENINGDNEVITIAAAAAGSFAAVIAVGVIVAVACKHTECSKIKPKINANTTYCRTTEKVASKTCYV